MNATSTIAPSLFISHGAPTFAIEAGELGDKLGQLGQALKAIRAIVVVSPHWETPDLRVSSNEAPATIHDFFGFPRELYAIEYPARGSAEVADLVVTALESAGLQPNLDSGQGMDHGVWVPLRYLRPEADIPVVCVSLPLDATPASALQIGQALAPLRERGMLILGTGSMTHNLGEFRGATTSAVQPYVLEFAGWIRDQIQARNAESLLQYRALAPHAVRAHPSEEHLLPLFVALGASTDADHFAVISDEVRYGMLSMESYYWH